MSHSKNQVVSTWKSVEDYLRHLPLKYQERHLSVDHKRIVADAYLLWYLAGIDLLSSLGISRNAFTKRWLQYLGECDVKEVFQCLKECDKLLLSLIEEDKRFSYASFKHSLRQNFPTVGSLLEPMKEVFVAWETCESIPSFSVLHCWLNFPSRLNLPNLKENEDDALQSYLAIDDSLLVDGFSTEEKKILSSWYPKTPQLEMFFTDNFFPCHGPGSTSDCGRVLSAKYRSIGTDPLIRYLEIRLPDQNLPTRNLASQFERVAKLQLVPKTLLSYRTISMEPATLMWYQQGFLSAWLRDLNLRKNHPVRRRFHPADQQSNRDLAWEGSINGSFATIDLSAASDSVSWALVKDWFSGTAMFRWMLATRSNEVLLPSGERIAPKKYAPMGSALCFPTECLIFSAITEAAIGESGGDARSSRYRVYGDDIIVESRYAQVVIDRLEKNGFRVNRTKTFLSSGRHIFRESCGGEYLDGCDVTPTRLSRWFSGLQVSHHTPGRIASIVELANDCYSRLPNVRRRCLHSLGKLPKELRVMFDGTGEKGIFSPSPTNFHLLEPTWSPSLQRWEVTCGQLRPQYPPRKDCDEDIRLYEHLRRTHNRPSLSDESDRVCVETSPPGRVLWRPVKVPLDNEEIFLMTTEK